ncbi:3-oxoacyl-ACP synthase [Winogradskyella sp. PE311]|uniref:3-oxoacyl-ACP synthase n=1 Tax=Winogradskyella sp. PE311 TaxID=3366943 RepID=UPI00398116CD
MRIKQKLYDQCKQHLNNRLKVVQSTITDIQNNLQSETKSSAGDKHETGRAMLQLEREKTGQQLAEIQKQFQILNKINPETKHNAIALGSVVYTTQFNYFVAISEGELKLDNEKFFAISPITPIGKLLMAKKKNDIFKFRNQNISILEVI